MVRNGTLYNWCVANKNCLENANKLLFLTISKELFVLENMFYYAYDDPMIYNNFAFLVEEYDMKYAYQTRDLGGGWLYSYHTFYNETGCFTVEILPTRGELDFYRSAKFSNSPDELKEQQIDIFSIKSAVWTKYKKIGFLPIPFPLIRQKRLLRATAEAIKDQLERENIFLDIAVEKSRGGNALMT